VLKIQGVIFAEFVSVESRGVSEVGVRFHGQVYHSRDGKSSNSTNDVPIKGCHMSFDSATFSGHRSR